MGVRSPRQGGTEYEGGRRKERERRFDALSGRIWPTWWLTVAGGRRPAADAQDAVSEVFLAAWRRLDEVPAGEEARLWLYGTARRVMANQARGRRRQALLQVRLSTVAVPGIDMDGASSGDGGVSYHGEMVPPLLKP